MTQPTLKAGATDAGYTYVTMLIVLVAGAITAQAAYIPSSTSAQRALEEQILFEGMAYRDAIQSYWELRGENRLPRRLEDLLRDPRDPSVRHIRELYAAEMWDTEYGADGSIQGVVPKREGAPFKQSGFGSDLEAFEGAESYRDWRFVVATQ